MSDQSYLKNAKAALLIGAAGSFLGNINGSVINVLLPTLSQSFQRGIGDMAILSLAFLLSQTLMLFIAGRLCDVKSTRTMFLWGFGFHVLFSLCCVFAPTLELLAVCRLVQGAATALITVAASVAVLRYTPMQRTGRAFGTITLSACLGFAIGPAIGGFLLEFMHWRFIFVIIFYIGWVPLVYTCLFYNDRVHEYPINVDMISVILSWFAIGSLFASLICLTRLGIGHPVGWSTLLLTCCGAFAFVRRCRRVSDPILSIKLLRYYPLVTALVGSLCNAICFSGLIFAVPFYLKFIRGLPDYQIGLIMMAAPITGLVGSYLGGKLSDRFGAKKCSLVITFISVPFLFAMIRINETTSPIILISLLGGFGLCYVFYLTSCTTMVMSWAKKGEEGKLSAIRLLLPVLGNAFGIAGFSLFFDNSTVPSTAQISEMLVNFRHGIWICLAIVLAQIVCTFHAKNVPLRSAYQSDTWQESRWQESGVFWDRG